MAGNRTSWKEGTSGNPGGRSRMATQVARMVRDETDGGRELITFVLAAFRDVKAPMKDRQWACEWLADRALGKPAISMELTIDEPPPGPGLDDSQLSGDELEVLAWLLEACQPGQARAAAPAALARIAGSAQPPSTMGHNVEHKTPSVGEHNGEHKPSVGG